MVYVQISMYVIKRLKFLLKTFIRDNNKKGKMSNSLSMVFYKHQSYTRELVLGNTEKLKATENPLSSC